MTNDQEERHYRRRPKPFSAKGIPMVERLRRFHGMTLRELEHSTGVPRTTLSRIAHGKFPDVRVALRIATAFQLSVEEIWGQAAKPASEINEPAMPVAGDSSSPKLPLTE